MCNSRHSQTVEEITNHYNCFKTHPQMRSLRSHFGCTNIKTIILIQTKGMQATQAWCGCALPSWYLKFPPWQACGKWNNQALDQSNVGQSYYLVWSLILSFNRLYVVPAQTMILPSPYLSCCWTVAVCVAVNFKSETARCKSSAVASQIPLRSFGIS